MTTSTLPKTMRALRLTAYDGRPESLQLVELPVPQPAAGQVLVRVAAAPINPSDQMFIRGLYGVKLGRAFFGESMFSRETDASKVCLVYLVERLRERGFALLDTQFTTEHLKRFGAVDVPRGRYEKLLEKALQGEAKFSP